MSTLPHEQPDVAPIVNQTIITKAYFTPQEFADATFADPTLKTEVLNWFSSFQGCEILGLIVAKK